MLFRGKRKISVRTVGDPVLNRVAAPVLEYSAGIVHLAEEMVVAMTTFNGIGLAAPQYGKSLRLIVIDVPEDSRSNPPTRGEEILLPQMPLALVNPEIVSSSDATAERDEGCLSVPEIFAPVIRPERVVLRARDLSGNLIECECGGLLARCLQHEIDHLDGKLFIDRLAPEAKETVAREVEILRRTGKRTNYLRTKTV